MPKPKPKRKTTYKPRTKPRTKPHKKKSTKKPTKKPRKTSTSKRVQHGGGMPVGGTDFDNLPGNIIGMVEYTVNSVVDFVDSAYYTINLGSNLGAAFGPNEPNPSSVKIPGEYFS